MNLRQQWAAIRRWNARWDARANRWMSQWGYFLLSCVALLVFVFGMPTFLAAAHNSGRFGTFTAADEECSGRGWDRCEWTGSFESDDRAIHRDHVSYDGGGITHPGDRVHVQWISSDESEAYAENDKNWLWGTAIAVPCACYLCWWISKKRWRGGHAAPARGD